MALSAGARTFSITAGHTSGLDNIPDCIVSIVRVNTNHTVTGTGTCNDLGHCDAPFQRFVRIPKMNHPSGMRRGPDWVIEEGEGYMCVAFLSIALTQFHWAAVSRSTSQLNS